MSTMQEAEGRPSNIGKLDECIHYRSDGLPLGPAADRGTRINQIADTLIAGQPLGSWLLEEAPEVACATWVAENALKLLERIETQKKMELVDFFVTPPELIMPGICDILGWNKEDEMLEVWDIKSGRYRDCQLQLKCYALMAMDLTGEVECKIRAAFCDERVFQEAIVSRGDCEEAVFGLIERIRINVEPPQENEYCGQCLRQSVCEVWTQPRDLALAIMDIDCEPLADMAPALDQTLKVQDRLELIKSDPKMLGRFIDAWRKAEKLIEKAGIEDAAKELLIAGKEVPGWRAQEYEGRAFYDKSQIESILQTWGESSADFLSVNTERYRGACENSDNEALEPAGRGKSYYKLLRKKI